MAEGGGTMATRGVVGPCFDRGDEMIRYISWQAVFLSALFLCGCRAKPEPKSPAPPPAKSVSPAPAARGANAGPSVKAKADVLEMLASPSSSDRIRAAERLGREGGIAGRRDTIDAVFQAIVNETDLVTMTYLFFPVNSCPDSVVIHRLFDLLEDDRPEVWYRAASALKNNLTYWSEDHKTRKDELAGRTRLRMGLFLTDLWKGHEEKAYEFVMSQTNYETDERHCILFHKCCIRLAEFGDERAVPVLARSIGDLFKNGKCEGRWHSPLIALRTINKLTGRNYGEAGKDLLTFRGREVRAVDWEAVVSELRKDLPPASGGNRQERD